MKAEMQGNKKLLLGLAILCLLCGLGEAGACGKIGVKCGENADIYDCCSGAVCQTGPKATSGVKTTYCQDPDDLKKQAKLLHVPNKTTIVDPMLNTNKGFVEGIGGLSMPVIVGIAASVAALLLAVCTGLFVFMTKKKHNKMMVLPARASARPARPAKTKYRPPKSAKKKSNFSAADSYDSHDFFNHVRKQYPSNR